MKPKKAGEKGGIVSIPMSIHASNVKLADKKAKAEKKPVAKKKAAKKASE
jgi:ribosomal protein L24